MSDPAAADAPPPPPQLLLLIRHAEQETMLVLDPPLSTRGVAQAERLGERLAALPLTAIVASPMRRARETADAIARRSGLRVEIEPDLEEIRMSDEELAERFGRTSARTMEPSEADYASAAIAAVRVVPRFRWPVVPSPDMETGRELQERTTAACERMLASHAAGVIACVAHGGVINSLLGEWLGATADMWFVPWHTGISSVLVKGSEHIILGINDASHLSADEDMLGLVAGYVRGSADPVTT